MKRVIRRRRPLKPAIPLMELLDRYVAFRNEEREIGNELSHSSVCHYTETIRAFSLFLDRPATTADLTVDRMNEFFVYLHAQGRSPHGIKSRKSGLRALFNFAKTQRLTRGSAARLRRIRCPHLSIEGYTAEQMQLLLQSFAGRQGLIRRFGIPQRIYYVSMLVTLWDTGLRIGDIPYIPVSKFNPEGLLWAHEHKTGKARWRRLSTVGTEMVAACIAHDPTRRTIWPGHNAKSLGRCVNRIIRASGLPGTSKWIRRGSSSDVDRRHPGQGWRFLAHSTPAVFEAHYRVPSICDDGAIAPSQLVIRGAE